MLGNLFATAGRLPGAAIGPAEWRSCPTPTSPHCSTSLLDEARAGLAEGGIPIGAALFAADGTLLGRGHNRRVQDGDPSMHAETAAFRAAGRQRDYRKTVMVTTLSPCWYCSGLVRQFGIGAVVIGEARTFTGGHDWLAEHGVEVTLLDDDALRGADGGLHRGPAGAVARGHRRGALMRPSERDPDRRPRRLAGRPDGRRRAGRRGPAAGGLPAGHRPRRRRRAAGGVRAAARRFFALPDEVKQRYAVRIGGRGWLAPGVEANGLVEGTETPPDLKESFAVGPDTPTGDPAVDAVWFPPNVWPAEVPELRAVVTRYTSAMRRVADDLLELCATALGLPVATLTSLATNPTWTFNINRYPPLTEVGQPADGQFRIGPHTDFGTVTVLDREPGAGGLQVFVTAADDPDGPGVWQDAPYDPDALTVNIGDLLAHWTGLRWSSGRHRVLPPQAALRTRN